MKKRKHNDGGIHIDESTHREVPDLGERLKHTLIAVVLGFTFYHIIGFWVFPGLGWFVLKPITSYSYLNVIDDLMTTGTIAYLACCAVLGWFRGPYFIDRLKGYINFWKFW